MLLVQIPGRDLNPGMEGGGLYWKMLELWRGLTIYSTNTVYSRMKTDVERTVDVEMDHRGRVIIPKNIRNRFQIEPAEGDTAWLTVTIEEAEVSQRGDE